MAALASLKDIANGRIAVREYVFRDSTCFVPWWRLAYQQFKISKSYPLGSLFWTGTCLRGRYCEEWPGPAPGMIQKPQIKCRSLNRMFVF